MNINFNIDQLRELMKAFYILSGIRFVLFDENFKEIVSYPTTNCAFCTMMKSNPSTRRKCNYADHKACEKCKSQNSLIIYKCHAGLCEAVIPLHENDKIAGYLMFGQIADNMDKSGICKKAEKLVSKYNLDPSELKNAIDKIAYKSSDEISSAGKIMEACTSYIILKELITPQSDRIFENAERYINNNLSGNLGIDEICKAAKTGRTRLYEIFRKETNKGISEYIRLKRLSYAKKLLKTTDISITEISQMVGFSDYNYFLRVFKTRYGKAPKSYRK